MFLVHSIYSRCGIGSKDVFFEGGGGVDFNELELMIPDMMTTFSAY